MQGMLQRIPKSLQQLILMATMTKIANYARHFASAIVAMFTQ
tara:strand:- start:121 stop:246 length:126 start_codon:yes stop_codon:yes gene_type:complete